MPQVLVPKLKLYLRAPRILGKIIRTELMHAEVIPYTDSQQHPK